MIDAPAMVDASSPSDSTQQPPDAMPVGCNGDVDCENPPVCATKGTCDLATHTCTFGALDCSGMNDECNVGVCSQSTGTCITQPARQGLSCGQGEADCSVGACGGFAGVCVTTGTQTRTCTKYTCQSGTCMGAISSEPLPCNRPSTDNTQCGEIGPPGDCGDCMDSGEFGCAPNGKQACTCNQPLCKAGVCQGVPTNCEKTGCVKHEVGDHCRTITNGCGKLDPRKVCCAADHTCTADCDADPCPDT